MIPGSRWKVEKISYKISRYPTTKKLTNADVDSEIKKALDVWGEYTNLSFEKKDVGQVIKPTVEREELRCSVLALPSLEFKKFIFCFFLGERNLIKKLNLQYATK